MSAALFNLNQDLKQLREDGYFVQITGGLLVMREVPYINTQQEVKNGTIISSLCLSGNVTQKPEPHTVHFEGEFPCNVDGTPIQGISAGAAPADPRLTAQYMLSSKPGPEGYQNYYQKMATYATIIAGPAAVLKPGSTPRVLGSRTRRRTACSTTLKQRRTGWASEH